MWYAVVIEAEVVPDVVGPFRSLDIAQETADTWNANHVAYEEPQAFVVAMTRDVHAIR